MQSIPAPRPQSLANIFTSLSTVCGPQLLPALLAPCLLLLCFARKAFQLHNSKSNSEQVRVCVCVCVCVFYYPYIPSSPRWQASPHRCLYRWPPTEPSLDVRWSVVVLSDLCTPKGKLESPKVQHQLVVMNRRSKKKRK